MDLTRTQKGLAALGALAVASVVFGLYDRFFWFDEALHAYNFFALTLLLTVYAYGVVLTGGREHGFILVLTIAAIGLGLRRPVEDRRVRVRPSRRAAQCHPAQGRHYP